MKFNKTGQLLLVSAAALLLSATISACLGTLSVDFIFVACSKAAGPNNYGELDVLEVDSQSGSLKPISTSPFFSQGRNPVAEVVSHDSQYLYVVNRDDNSIVQFLIGSDGKLYAESTTNTPGIFPVALAVDPSDSYLYVVDTYQPLATCSPVAPCAGSLAIFPILTKTQVTGQTPVGSLGPAVINNDTGFNYFPITIGSDIVTPQGINILANGNNVYVTAKDTTTSQGYVFGFAFSFDTSSSPITATATQTVASAGTLPGAITSSPNSSTVYVADQVNLANAPAGNNVFVYTVNGGGALSLSATYPAGNTPSSIAIDPSGTHLYVANAVDSNISAFSVSGITLSSLGNYAAGNYPVAIVVDPRLGQFVYVGNYLGSNVSGFELNTANDTLVNSVNTPFKTDAQVTSLAAIPHNGSTH